MSREANLGMYNRVYWRRMYRTTFPVLLGSPILYELIITADDFGDWNSQAKERVDQMERCVISEGGRFHVTTSLSRKRHYS